MLTAATRFGRYLLGERLATGGMGEVYLAVQTGIGSFAKPLALKLLLPHLSERPDAVAMFLEEARLAAQMHHANVAQIYDVGVERGRYFIAMELVRGVALSQLIAALRRNSQRLDATLLVYVARALCDGLHHAHELADARGRALNLVHRDVTPHNVLVSTDGDLKLTDFGIARAGAALPKADERLVGKLPWLPPEQLDGQVVDRRADLYSAAVTLYQLATLEHPSGEELGPREGFVERRFEPFAPLASKRPDLPPAFAATIDRAASKRVDERFSTAREWRNAMPEVTPGAGERLGQLVRELCRDAVEHLDAKTYHATAVQRRTEQLLRSGPIEARKPPARRGRVTAGLGATALLAAALLGQWLYSGQTPVPVAAPVLPERDVSDAVEQPAEPSREPSRRPRPATARHVSATPNVGFLTIDADPWAQVYLSGALVGETPLSAFPVEAGTVELELRNPETGRRVKRRVVVKSGLKTALRVDMR